MICPFDLLSPFVPHFKVNCNYVVKVRRKVVKCNRTLIWSIKTIWLRMNLNWDREQGYWLSLSIALVVYLFKARPEVERESDVPINWNKPPLDWVPMNLHKSIQLCEFLHPHRRSKVHIPLIVGVRNHACYTLHRRRVLTAAASVAGREWGYFMAITLIEEHNILLMWLTSVCVNWKWLTTFS